MQQLPSVFISYNPGVEFEETLAIRLHTIGAVHGFNMLLPDRSAFRGPLVSSETANRIRLADYFIIFSTSLLSDAVQKEIEVAFEHLHDKAKIIIVYDSKVGKNLQGGEMCTEIFIDSSKPTQQILQTILNKIESQNGSKKNPQPQGNDVLGGILLAGLGLLLLGALLGDGKGK
ncbi:MAG: hypothetical protein RIF36_17115 [Imperialibacter sp.]|uniref:hypothetical protein n=1 Tax=Imperialibacter sp. TaxID=2038411 RepID=UPI0032EFDC55